MRPGGQFGTRPGIDRNSVRIGGTGSLSTVQLSTWSPYFHATYAAYFSNSTGVSGDSHPAAGAGSPSCASSRVVVGLCTHSGNVKWLTVMSGSRPCARRESNTSL